MGSGPAYAEPETKRLPVFILSKTPGAFAADEFPSVAGGFIRW
jgi:hypothetical protein